MNQRPTICFRCFELKHEGTCVAVTDLNEQRSKLLRTVNILALQTTKSRVKIPDITCVSKLTRLTREAIEFMFKALPDDSDHPYIEEFLFTDASLRSDLAETKKLVKVLRKALDMACTDQYKNIPPRWPPLHYIRVARKKI